jgi:hypothetical protein
MSGFTKLVPEIIQSSIWNEPPEIRCVWIAMIATKDQNGYVRGDPRTIARMANVSLESTEKALALFQEPDPSSHTPDNEGRRIAAAPGGWIVLNHELYRTRDHQAEHAAYVKAWRHGSIRPREDGYVYFLATSTAIKIGYSKNPWARSYELTTGLSEKPELLYTFKGTTDDERGLHNRFAHLKIQGEWFRRDNELLAHVEELRSKNVNHTSASVSASASDTEGGCKGGVSDDVPDSPGQSRTDGPPGEELRWTLEDCVRAAAPINMPHRMIEDFYQHYAAVNFIDGAGRRICSLPHALAKWKANQTNKGDSHERRHQSGRDNRGDRVQDPREYPEPVRPVPVL